MALGIGKTFYNTITYRAYTWDDVRNLMSDAGLTLSVISDNIDDYFDGLSHEEMRELESYFKPDTPKESLLSDTERADGTLILPLNVPECVVRYYTAILGEIL